MPFEWTGVVRSRQRVRVKTRVKSLKMPTNEDFIRVTSKNDPPN